MKTLKNAMLIASILFIPITMEILSFTSLITEADVDNKDNVKTRQVVVVEEVDAIKNQLNREVTLDK